MKLRTIFGTDIENYSMKEEDISQDMPPEEWPADAEFTNGILSIQLHVHGDAPSKPFIQITGLASLTEEELFEIFSNICELEVGEWFEYEE